MGLSDTANCQQTKETPVIVVDLYEITNQRNSIWKEAYSKQKRKLAGCLLHIMSAIRMKRSKKLDILSVGVEKLTKKCQIRIVCQIVTREIYEVY